MKKTVLTVILSILVIFSCKKQEKITSIPLHKKMEEIFSRDISDAIAYSDSLSNNLDKADLYFRKSREAFKKLEPILAFVDVNNYATLNQPNILKIKEEDYTDIKITNPLGYQVLEEAIYSDEVDKKEIQKNAIFISNRLRLVKKNTNFNHLKNYHFLWMLKKEIARIAFTGITGFDSPVLENSLEDAKTSYLAIKKYLNLLKNKFKNEEILKKWNTEIDNTIKDLTAHFNNFDRYNFIKNHSHKQLELYIETVRDWNVTFPFELEMNDNATSFFSDKTFNVEKFADFKTKKITPEKVSLGKKLFYDKSLSKSKTISCASCHQIDKAFTDGLTTPENLTRNSPTLMYAALQKGFFHDKRSGGLEGQIVDVIKNEDEFHTNFKELEEVVKSDKEYKKLYNTAYPNKKISDFYIRNAIATFERTLVPFNSKFDRNINGVENTLTQEEVLGFNLFTGKAKCVTCHFAPVFNGTVPPDFKDTEMELIGTPEKSDTINAAISKDLGRFYIYKTEERKHFFKTPTIRNVEKTAPYMHNGVYKTLEEVVDFYNRGGGAGIGINQELQTLPTDQLNLTKEEQKALVAFMKTLTDTVLETEY